MNDEMAEHIAAQLRRIADGIEALVEQRAMPQNVTYDAILDKVPLKLGDKRAMFAQIVYDNLSKHPGEICKLLKAAKVLAPSTYWKDVKMLREMRE